MSTDPTIVPWTITILDILTVTTRPAGSVPGALGLGPPPVSRVLALIYTAAFQAWAAYTKDAKKPESGKPHFIPAAENTPANNARAVSYAIYTAAAHVFRASASAEIKAMLDAELASQQPNAAIDNAAQAGIDAAGAVIAARDKDGSNWQNGYQPPDALGYAPKNPPAAVFEPTWRRGIPFPSFWQELIYLDPATHQPKGPHFITPHWRSVKPFALHRADQFRPKTSPARVSEQRYVDQARHVLEVQQNLTFRQKVIAEFWADGPRSWLPPGHWCELARCFVEKSGYTLDQNVALFFAMTNAVFDASIATWEAKLFYDSVRPITAIRWLFNGHRIRGWTPDGQIQEIAGETWRPFQKDTFPTPPFPEYTSGHSAFSMAAATVLTAFAKSSTFGCSFERAADPLAAEPGVPVSEAVKLEWPTFIDATIEAGESRIFGGIHFQEGNIAGLELGRLVGENAWREAVRHFPDDAGHSKADAESIPHFD